MHVIYITPNQFIWQHRTILLNDASVNAARLCMQKSAQNAMAIRAPTILAVQSTEKIQQSRHAVICV